MLIKDLRANHHFWSWVLLIIFRYGQFIDNLPLPKIIKLILSTPYFLGDTIIIEGLLHCHFPRTVKIEPGISLFHPYGIMLNRNTVIGSGVIIRNNVTIGVKHQGEPTFAVIESGVDIGAGAKILGSVRIGRYCKIGANAVVLKNFSAGSIIAGVPAKKIRT
ncbi:MULTISPECIES: hypothetical protein [Streptococcus]|uniref:Serine acetyltransferase n=2 Tax=Streptococcus lactarius TaxID=684066 RepID=A0A9X1BAK8_9STRE|nr:hypothetical protein [Streptococcus lactarius]MBK4778741.1 hypothetical protein [Streptococcus lactarius]QUB39780.1 hypothetical protein J4854_04870 [Streptococcus lactarius]